MTRAVRLTDTDWILLKALWGKPPQMMRYIVQSVKDANQNIKWSYKTYYTYLNNLCGKGFAAYETCNAKADRLYYPLITREEAMWMESESLLSHVSGDPLSKLFAAMATSRQLNSREQQQLKELVSKLEREERQGD
jgi:predicted transcriptional regulator